MFSETQIQRSFRWTATGITVLGFACYGLWALAGATKDGGDEPFPLHQDEGKVELKQVWETSDGSQKVKIYLSETGETFVILEQTKKQNIEILKKTF